MVAPLRTVPASVAPWLNRQRVEPEPTLDFARVFDAHATFVWRVLRRLGVPDADAEDAVQDVFIVVHAKRREYEERGSIRSWLFAISRQVASHRRRSVARRERTRASLPEAPPQANPQELAMRGEAVALVQAFLSQLDEPQAIVFYLADVEGMTAPEIAGALDVNLNTVYGRLRVARQRFEAFIDRSTPEGGEAR
jgi:RNA polymerase sigma-70 factor (ECF subfamily)